MGKSKLPGDRCPPVRAAVRSATRQGVIPHWLLFWKHTLQKAFPSSAKRTSKSGDGQSLSPFWAEYLIKKEADVRSLFGRQGRSGA
jgi:hypothetical protein